MASEIKVDTIVNAGGDNDTGIDLATNDQILLKVANATRLTMNSTGQTTIVGEGGTTTTNLQTGLCKVWHDSNGAGTTLNDNFNVSSLGDTATGKQTINLTNAMSNATYCCCVVLNDGNMRHIGAVGRATGSYRTEVFSTTNNGYHDEPTGSQVVGDLA